MFANKILQLIECISDVVRPLMVPFVPTGMKMGRSTSPCGRVIIECRANLAVLSSLNWRAGDFEEARTLAVSFIVGFNSLSGSNEFSAVFNLFVGFSIFIGFFKDFV